MSSTLLNSVKEVDEAGRTAELLRCVTVNLSRQLRDIAWARWY